MTDNKIWDTIIEPQMEVSIVNCCYNRLRGIRLVLPYEDSVISVTENKTNNIGTNFKKARQSLINKVRKRMDKEEK